MDDLCVRAAAHFFKVLPRSPVSVFVAGGGRESPCWLALSTFSKNISSSCRWLMYAAAYRPYCAGLQLGLGRRCVGETQRDELVGQHGIKKCEISHNCLWSFKGLKRAQVA